MKTVLVILLALMPRCLCGAREHKSNNVMPLQPPSVESGEEMAETQGPRTETEGGEEELARQSDIWAELRNLRDMVVEQKVELRHLTARVKAAESRMEALEKENTAMEARMNAAESLAEELQMENDAQTTELAVAQQKLSTVQQRLTVTEHRVEELEKQQEGQNVTVQQLQDTNRVRELAFSASLLASGEGNTENPVSVDNPDDPDSPSIPLYIQLIYKNVFTNIGNHYNPHTGYFTAPVRGVYYFRFTGHVAHTDFGMRLRLVKNGHAMVFTGDRSTTSSEDAEDNACNGVVLQLEVGDVVSVQMHGAVWDDQYHRTTFSGFMLFPL